jgi:hypothetical protein
MSLIPPRQAWALMIDITTRCIRSCSNCTRLLGWRKNDEECHRDMDAATFREACRSVADFPADSDQNEWVKMPKMIGLIGGEPFMHPQFETLVDIMMQEIPDRAHRGLWTGVPMDEDRKMWADERFAYVNHNVHVPPCSHQPVLVGSSELVKDRGERRKWVENCWVNARWSPTITTRGCYFCEVAAALDAALGLGIAKTVRPGWWREDLSFFNSQIAACCHRCGIAMPMPARLDNERKDDISPDNLELLRQAWGAKLPDRKFELFDCQGYDPEKFVKGWMPYRYMRGGK